MNKFNTLLLLTILLPLSVAYGQGWKYTFGGESSDNGESIIQTADHGYVIAGWTQSFGGNGDFDIYATRYDVDGRLVWTRTYDEGFNERGHQILSDEDGNLLIAGEVELTQTSTFDPYLMKIDPAGNLLWAKNYKTVGASGIQDITPTADGGYLLTGYLEVPEANNSDALMLKVDAEGNELWRKSYGSSGKDEKLMAVARLGDGFAMAGSVVDTVASLNLRNPDFFVMTIDENGDMGWNRNYGSSSDIERAVDLVVANDGGLLVAGNKGNSLFHLIKLTADGVPQWSKTYGEGPENYCNSILQQPDGSIYLLGTSLPYNYFNALTYLVKTDANGQEVWAKTYGEGERYEEGFELIPTLDGGFAIAGIKEVYIFSQLNDILLIKTDANGNIYSNSVEGRVFHDVNFNCEYDEGIDQPLNDWLVRVNGEANSFIGSTNEDGTYAILADTGLYNISVLQQNDYWVPCWDDQNRTFTQFYDTIQLVDFPIQSRITCPLMEVNVAAAGLNVCEDVTYVVDYCNSGTVPAEEAYVEVELDELLEYNSSTLPLASQNGNTLRFDLGRVENGDCGNFEISTSLACEGYVLGQSHTVTAHIYPDTLCVMPDPEWDMASITVNGECSQDSVSFLIQNKGTGAMQTKRSYIIVEDVVMLRQEDYQLEPQERLPISLEATGATYRLIAEQSIGHPGSSYPTIAIEGCDEDGNANISVGYVTLFPEDDEDPFISIDVQENAGANAEDEMRAFPKGYGADNFVEPNTALTYQIDFANTGTDTITQVVIRDTLSTHLDITSIEPGASSHPYDFELYNNGIIRFTLKDLKMLPGENGGFVRFKVAQKPDLPKGTVIENSATLYLGYQKPAITNEIFHTVGGELEEFLEIVTSSEEVFVPGVQVQVEPNPFVESAIINVEGLTDFHNFTFSLYDPQGRVLRHEQHATNRIPLQRGDLTAGLYFYRIEADGRLLNTGKLIVK